MRQKKIICYLLAAVLALTACSTDDDDYTATLYGDAAITAFSLGTLNRYIDGEKSTYAGSAYAMQIDQLAHTIENIDSLPIYTDAAHVIAHVSARNNGVIVLKNKGDEDFTYYSSADSIDFSDEENPRIFRVWASNGVGYTDYKVKINVHKEDGDALVWQPQAEAAKPDRTLPIGLFLGESTYEEYAFSNDGKVMHKAKGAETWEQDIADDHEDIGSVPVSDVALVDYPMALADSTDYVLMAGITADGTTAVWRKIVDNTGKTAKGNWTYLDRGDETIGLLPALANLSLIRYDGVTMAFGGKEGDYTSFYESRDNGITWQASSRISLPEDLDTEQLASMFVTTDDDNYVWIYAEYEDGTKPVWKGRLNRLGWKE